MICLWFFLSDGVFTIAHRLLKGERIWTAHRSHLYQRLVRTGLRHDEVVLKVIGGALALATLAVISALVDQASLWWGSATAGIAGFFAYYRWTCVREKLVKESV